jgi:hypothetical protein
MGFCADVSLDSDDKQMVVSAYGVKYIPGKNDLQKIFAALCSFGDE